MFPFPAMLNSALPRLRIPPFLCFLTFYLFVLIIAPAASVSSCRAGDIALSDEECAKRCATLGDQPTCPANKQSCSERSSFFNDAVCCQKHDREPLTQACDIGQGRPCYCATGSVKGSSIAIVAGCSAAAVLLIFIVSYFLFRKKSGRTQRQDEARLRLEEQARLEALQKGGINNAPPDVLNPDDRKSNAKPPPGYPSVSSNSVFSSGPSPNPTSSTPSFSPPPSHAPSAPESFMVYPDHQPQPPAPHLPGTEGMYSYPSEAPPPIYNAAPPIHEAYGSGSPTYGAASGYSPYDGGLYPDVHYNSGPPR